MVYFVSNRDCHWSKCRSTSNWKSSSSTQLNCTLTSVKINLFIVSSIKIFSCLTLHNEFSRWHGELKVIEVSLTRITQQIYFSGSVVNFNPHQSDGKFVQLFVITSKHEVGKTNLLFTRAQWLQTSMHSHCFNLAVRVFTMGLRLRCLFDIWSTIKLVFAQHYKRAEGVNTFECLFIVQKNQSERV